MRTLAPESKTRGDHPDDAYAPKMREAYDHEKIKGASLAAPRRVQGADGEETIYLVESSAGGVYAQQAGATPLGDGFCWRVSIKAFLEGRYEEACECGRNASAKAACKHVMRVLLALEKVHPHPTFSPGRSLTPLILLLEPSTFALSCRPLPSSTCGRRTSRLS